MPGRFGGVAIEEPKSRFGGVALEDAPDSAPAPAAPVPAPGANPARNRRQANLNSGLTAEQAKARREAVTGLIQAYPGFTQTEQGVSQLGTPGQRKAGLHNVIVGAGKFASPTMLPVAVLAPGATAAALATGAVAGAGGTAAARFAGADPDTADLVGDASAIVGGGLAGAPGRTGLATRGALRGAAESLPIVGKVLKGAWEGAERALGEGKPSAPASLVPAPKSATAPAGSLAKPVPAPATGPAKAPGTDDLDAIARSLGGKDFESLPENQQKAVKRAAELAKQPPASAPRPAGPVPAPTGPTKAPVVSTISEADIPAPLQKPSVKPIPAPTSAPQGAQRTLQRGAHDPVSVQFASPADSAAFDAQAKASMSRSGGQNPRGVDMGPLGDEAKKLAGSIGVDESKAREILADYHSYVKDLAKSQPPRGENIGDLKVQPMSLDQFAKSKSSSGPIPAPPAPAQAPVPAPQSAPGAASGDYYRVHGQVKKAITVANDLYSKGITAQQLEQLPLEQRKEALGKGHSDETFSRILFELRGLETGKAKPTTAAPSTAGSGAPAPVTKPVTGYVRTPAQTKAKYQWKISEADNLKTSFDPDYNTEIGHQPRDTSRIQSRQRVEQRKADMDPNAMGASTMAGDGAPITLDNNAVTRNHGTQAVKELYAEGRPKAAEYRDYVTENAGLAGMTPEEVSGMKNPVLHRELIEPGWKHEDVKKFADEANMSSTARMSEAELAKQMAEKLSGPMMGRFKVNDSGVPDPEFVRQMIRDLPVEEQGQFSQRTGEVSQLGARLIRNAVFERAYTSTGALETMAEATNPQVKNIATAMLNSAPEMAKLNDAVESGNAYDLRIGKQVGTAMETIERLRHEKKSVPDWLKQKDMLGRDPVVTMLVHFLGEQSRRPTVIRQMLQNYAESVAALGKPNQGNLFGETSLPTRQELLESAYENAVKARESTGEAEPSLFEDKQ